MQRLFRFTLAIAILGLASIARAGDLAIVGATVYRRAGNRSRARSRRLRRSARHDTRRRGAVSLAMTGPSTPG